MLVFHHFHHGGLSSLRLCEQPRSAREKRYSEKISCVGMDPVLIPEKTYDPECLAPVESMDLLSYLVLKTSYYSKDQFKAFRSLQAYNQLVSGFVSSVKGHKISDQYMVLGKVRHSQRMNDPNVTLWIITENSSLRTLCWMHGGTRRELLSYRKRSLLHRGMESNKGKTFVYTGEMQLAVTYVYERRSLRACR